MAVDPGELILSICATIGVPIVVDIPVCIHDGFVVIRSYDSALDRDFLYYYLSSTTSLLAHSGQPGTQRNLNASIVGQIQVPRLPLPEQRKIAEILGTWDEAIALLERRIAAARERKKGLMQRLLTGQVRFPGFTEPWREVTLGEVAKVNPPRVRGIADDRRVSFVAMSDVSEEGHLLASATRLYSDVKMGYTPFQDGDVLIAKITPCFENGKGALVHGLESGLGFGSTEFHVVRADESMVLPEFAYYHTTARPFRQLGAAEMVGSAGQKRVQPSYVANYRLFLPSIPEQNRIVSVLSESDQETALLTAKLNALQSQKKGLMQRLLAGQVRVTALLEADLERAVPIHRELAGLGWVPETADVSQRIVSICDFLGIESLAETPTLRRAARQTRTRESLRIAEIAWGKRVERLARQQKVGPYLPAALRDAIPDLLDYASKPTDVAHVPGFLAKYGVHFVILRHLEQTYLDGALLYTDENPIIALTLRYDRLDSFWFTLMHELAHLLLGHEGVHLDTIDKPGDTPEEEREANRQAEDWLIDREAYERFRRNRWLSHADLNRLAQERGLHPSIVAGRIRHDRNDHSLFRAYDVAIGDHLDPWLDTVLSSEVDEQGCRSPTCS